MLKRPSLSLVAVRTFSISAGLAASTVTPGKTPPDVSLTTPAMLLVCWADAAAAHSNQERTTTPTLKRRDAKSHPLECELLLTCVTSKSEMLVRRYYGVNEQAPIQRPQDRASRALS